MIDLDEKDVRGLSWLEQRSRLWLVGFRRGRKCLIRAREEATLP